MPIATPTELPTANSAVPGSEIASSQLARPQLDYHVYPDADGHFGRFGGRFVAETLMPLIHELNDAYEREFKEQDS